MLANHQNPRLAIVTGAGTIEVELAPAAAPLTAANFLAYVAAGIYTNSSFYRTVTPDNQPDNAVKIEVIQGGLSMDPTVGPARNQPIALETTHQTGLKHRDGTLSMSRLAPDSATTEFFICIGDQPELDYGGKRNPDGQGFAAFGRVVRGQEVVKRIQLSPHEKQDLTPPVAILEIKRLV
jgi:peptidyl-prolyl cis-trans isomerase A (cyclophilin A)